MSKKKKPACCKTRYESAKDANKARRHMFKSKHRILWAYQCPSCNKYHLTSNPR